MRIKRNLIIGMFFSVFLGAEVQPENLWPEEKPMVIVIPSYNNKEWHVQNLDSVFSQSYHRYRVIYIDDASTDGTGELVKNYIDRKGLHEKIALIQNHERMGSLANLYKAIWACGKDEIVVDLDGDDWLYHEGVLAYLNETYRDPAVWMTYGQFIQYPSQQLGFAKQIPIEVIKQNEFRARGGYVTHLRTFYAALFQKIMLEDFLYEGTFLPSAGDVAFIYPLIEMAGEHAKFIPEILYVYNRQNPINDDKVNFSLQHDMGQYISQKEKYIPLDHL